MNDLLPIVEGCLCMVVGSCAGNNGKTVTAIRRTEKPINSGAHIGPWWEIDPPLQWRNLRTGMPSRVLPVARESFLMRIDGHDEQDTEVN